ncbi:hypothetical protein [Streptomyces olivaceiscleroticus]|uniref:Uncharacterized protein n=1 Tax=Streptomyces olivaceiscleroticus TaxID=68245 RepID=A0ABN1AA60_9ACTN
MSRRGSRDPGCWPFLVARGRVVGQRTLLVPGFLAERGLSGLLRDAITGSLTQEGESRHAEASLPDGGRIGLSYRIVQASPPGAEGVVLRDRSGRPIELAYGVVVTGATGARVRIPVADAELPGLRPMALEVFARFLADERAFRPLVSAYVPVATLAAGTAPVPEPGPEPARPAAPGRAEPGRKDAPAAPVTRGSGDVVGWPEATQGRPRAAGPPEARPGLVGWLLSLLRGPGAGLWVVVLLAGWPVALVLALALALRD